MFSLSFFPVSASDFQDVFFDDSSSQLVVYFDLEAHKDLEAAVAFSLPLTYSGLYSDSTPSNSQENWVLEYPFVQTSSVLLSGANFTKRYKLILSYSTLSFSDLDSSWIAFLRNSQLRENISLSLLEYNQSGGLLDSSLPFGIFRTCSFETGEAHSCSETLPFEVSANTSYSIRLPLFLNASKVASLTNVSFEFSPPSSSGLSGDLGSTHLRTLELRYPDDLLIYHSNKLTVLAPANLSFPLWQSASSLYGLKSFTEGNFSGTPASLLYVTDTGFGLIILLFLLKLILKLDLFFHVQMFMQVLVSIIILWIRFLIRRNLI